MADKVTYHSAITGKFVSKEFAKDNPGTTVELRNCNLRQELIDLCDFINEVGSIDVGSFDCVEDLVDDYLEQK